MSVPPAPEPLPRRPAQDIPKIRHCLRCRAPFESEGFGERICRHCKSLKDWRIGAPVATRFCRNG